MAKPTLKQTLEQIDAWIRSGAAARDVERLARETVVRASERVPPEAMRRLGRLLDGLSPIAQRAAAAAQQGAERMRRAAEAREGTRGGVHEATREDAREDTRGRTGRRTDEDTAGRTTERAAGGASTRRPRAASTAPRPGAPGPATRAGRGATATGRPVRSGAKAGPGAGARAGTRAGVTPGSKAGSKTGAKTGSKTEIGRASCRERVYACV